MRTALLGAAGAVLMAVPTAQADHLSYRGYVVAFSPGLSSGAAKKAASSTRCQIDIVEGVGLPAETTAFFRTVRFGITADVVNGQYGTGMGIHLSARQLGDKTPVLLHEYLHAFHLERMTPGYRQALATFYGRARSAGLFPADSYMLTNVKEFFAMTASAYLYGRIQRDPFTREKLKQAMPVYYDWLGQQLGVPETALVPAGQMNCD